jgi:hypothetical protein
MSFSQVQRVFIVEHYLESRSYLTCQSVLWDTFPDSPVPKKLTIARMVNRFRGTGTVHQIASFEAITAASMKMTVFSALAPCSQVKVYS